jgi:hypothetical protein
MVIDLPCNGFGYAAELAYEVPVATNIELSSGVKLLISVFGFFNIVSSLLPPQLSVSSYLLGWGQMKA